MTNPILFGLDVARICSDSIRAAGDLCKNGTLIRVSEPEITRDNLTSGGSPAETRYPNLSYAISTKLERLEDSLAPNYVSVLLLLGHQLREQAEGLRPRVSDKFEDADGNVWHIVEIRAEDPASATFSCRVERGDTGLALPASP